MWKLERKEGWTLKSWIFWIVVHNSEDCELQKTLESPLDLKQIKPVHPKGNWSWILIGKTCWSWSFTTLATWYKELTQKSPQCWERLKAEEYNRGWDYWIVSPTQWTWVWASSGRWWRSGKPLVLQSMGSWRVRHDWATDNNKGGKRLVLRKP